MSKHLKAEQVSDGVKELVLAQPVELTDAEINAVAGGQVLVVIPAGPFEGQVAGSQRFAPGPP